MDISDYAVDTAQHFLEADKILRWDGPKRKPSSFSAEQGRLVLTDQRLMFTSTATNDRRRRSLLGGLDVPVSRVRAATLHDRSKGLTIVWTDRNGIDSTSTFALKNGGMPNGRDWIVQIEAAQSGPRVVARWLTSLGLSVVDPTVCEPGQRLVPAG